MLQRKEEEHIALDHAVIVSGLLLAGELACSIDHTKSRSLCPDNTRLKSDNTTAKPANLQMCCADTVQTR